MTLHLRQSPFKIFNFLENTVRNVLNPLNVELNPICHLLALLGAYNILHVSRIRVNYVHGGYKFVTLK